MLGFQITLIHLAYLLASVLFILGIKRLSSVRTARQGNNLAALAMGVAIVTTLFDLGLFAPRFNITLILVGIVVGSAIGAYYAHVVKMENMPQMVAIFNGMGGAASLLVAISFFIDQVLISTTRGTAATLLQSDGAITIFLSVLIGGITLTGSVIAFGKLQGVKWVPDEPVTFANQHAINLALVLATIGIGYITFFMLQSAGGQGFFLFVLCLLCLALGVLLVIPIGGGDMPVVISLLNSYSGLAAAMTGFVIQNQLLIISGSLVGASGLILTHIMCKAMNRSLISVLLGGFGAEGSSGSSGKDGYGNIRETDADEVAAILDIAASVIIVPGYGMAVSQAQHAVRELGKLLEQRDCQVKYAIHPVAGRMPGHMNVLLAESDVPYEQLYELEQINSEFKNCDLAIVLGANDVVNPDALDKKDSPIYGMPILHVHESHNVLVIKRSLSPGYAKIANPLFDAPNAMMYFADGRAAIEAINKELKDNYALPSK